MTRETVVENDLTYIVETYDNGTVVKYLKSDIPIPEETEPTPTEPQPTIADLQAQIKELQELFVECMTDLDASLSE